MAVQQRLSINKSLTSRDKIVVRDDTGPYTKTNENGYGGYNGIPIGSFLKYIFIVTDKISGATFRRTFGEGVDEETNPPVERIGFREEVDIIPISGKLRDSIYTVTMIVVIEDEYEGTAIKGQDYIINVPGTEVIKNYNSIISPSGEVYKIRQIIDQVVFLDREIVEDFEYFNVGLQTTSEVVVIYQSLEDCITSKILDFLDSDDCSPRITNNINELRMLYWGIQFSMESNDYNASFEYMRRVQNICSFLNCGCNG